MNGTLILIVEDDADIRESFSDILTDEGYRVAFAENGEIALKYLENCTEYPELILLDVLMPVKDGLTFRKEQLAHPKFGHLPVVVLSASHKMVDLVEQMKASGYLKKPISIDELLEAIAISLQK